MSTNEISQALNRSQSTISRELLRNTGKRGYRYKQAGRLAQNRHQAKEKSVKLTDEIKLMVDDYLKQDWRPEQIVGRLKLDGVITLHHETIYQYVLSDKEAGGMLCYV